MNICLYDILRPNQQQFEIIELFSIFLRKLAKPRRIIHNRPPLVGSS